VVGGDAFRAVDRVGPHPGSSIGACQAGDAVGFSEKDGQDFSDCLFLIADVA
jgi:hypothetical protein